MMINNMTRRYLEGSGTHNQQDIIRDITTARKNRPMLVQKPQQLETLNTVAANSIELFKPLAEQFNIDAESLYTR